MVAIVEESQNKNVDEAWKSIENLFVGLRDSVHFYQHYYRGEPWLVIADQQEENYFRCNSEAKYFLTLLDGRKSVGQAFIESSLSDSGEQLSDNENSYQSLTKKDVVLLIANLKSSNLLIDDEGEQGEEVSKFSSPSKKSNSWLRPFSIKFSLFDPDKFLDRTVRYVKPLFNAYALIMWLVLVFVAVTVAMMNWSSLVEHGQARFDDPKNLLWYWLLYPLIKTLHELGHAYATKIWGGVVHEMGVMLLVFFPVPYVDGSASHRFSSKRHRIVVSAAGIMVEVFLAAVAVFVWVNTDSGVAHDIAFDIIIIGGVSTVLFNANPLLRFDGYYIFSELIEMPNLGTRSTQYLGYLFKNYVLDIEGIQSPVSAKGEIKWLFFYGISAAIYRLFISLFIAIWVAGKFFFVGLVLSFWAVIMQIIYPAVMWFYRLIPIVYIAQRVKRLSFVFILFCSVLLFALLVPVGHSTYAEGIIKLPENALIRAGADGIVKQVLQKDGGVVDAGVTILTLENLELSTQKRILLAKLKESTSHQNNVLLQDRMQADIAKSKVLALKAELENIQMQIENLNVKSFSHGVMSLPMINDLPGRYVKRGEVIGYVADLRQVSAKVVIPQSSIDAVRRDSGLIEVRLKSRADEILTAQLIRELPQMTDQLPSRSLGSGAGGDIAIDARDSSGVQAMSNIFQVEIALPMRNTGNYLGQRIYVRFIHNKESLGKQLLQRINQNLLDSPFTWLI